MEPTTRDAAAEVLRRGWNPVRIRPGSKEPFERGWTTRTYTSAELSAFDGYNLGIRLDAPLVDIDLDCEEAVSFGGLLPSTGMRHGRAGFTRHYWYLVHDERSEKHVYTDPVRMDLTGSMAILAEWRTGRHQTVIPPSTHPSGEALEWKGPGQQWGEPAEVSYDLLRKRLRWVAACALIARYWPAKGSRHTADLAYCGGIAKINDPDLHRYVPLILQGAARVADDDEYESRGVASWRGTAKAHASGEPVTSWGTLVTECEIPKPVVDRIEELLTPENPPEPDPEELSDDHSGSFHYQKSTDELRALVLSGSVPSAEMLVPDLIYADSVVWLVGKPGDGKTLMALYLIKQVLERGKVAVLFDEESGGKRIARRLIPFGLTPDELSRFYYYNIPGVDFRSTSACVNLREQLVEQLGADLVVFDSTADIITNSGYDENSNKETTQLYNELMLPLKQAGCAVLALDHQAKAAYESIPGQPASSTQTARGAGAKLGKVDLQWNFKGKIDKDTTSSISFVRAKDRDGDMPAAVHFSVTGNDEKIVVERTSHAGRPLGDIVDRVVAFLRSNARGSENAVHTAVINNNTTGDARRIADALAWLRTEDGRSAENVVFYQDGNKNMYFYDPAIELDFGHLPGTDEEDEGAEAA